MNVQRHEDPRGTSFEVSRFRDIRPSRPSFHPRSNPRRTVVPVESAEVEAPATLRSSGNHASPKRRSCWPRTIRGSQKHVTDLLSDRYRVLTAPNGKAALAIAREHLPDLLVTDLEMPEIDGIELTRAFLALQETTLSPVLIVSAHAGLGDRLAGFEAGAVDYVLKPFSAEPSSWHEFARSSRFASSHSSFTRARSSPRWACCRRALAHELRNPANALVNALEPLMESVPRAPARRRTPAQRCSRRSRWTRRTRIRQRCEHILDFLARRAYRFAGRRTLWLLREPRAPAPQRTAREGRGPRGHTSSNWPLSARVR